MPLQSQGVAGAPQSAGGDLLGVCVGCWMLIFMSFFLFCICSLCVLNSKGL
jgi:hypothetical protein